MCRMCSASQKLHLSSKVCQETLHPPTGFTTDQLFRILSSVIYRPLAFRSLTLTLAWSQPVSVKSCFFHKVEFFFYPNSTQQVLWGQLSVWYFLFSSWFHYPLQKIHLCCIIHCLVGSLSNTPVRRSVVSSLFLFVAALLLPLKQPTSRRRARRMLPCLAQRTSSVRRSRSLRTSRSFWELPRIPNMKGIEQLYE